MFFFFFNDTATTEIYTLSLHDALPISHQLRAEHRLVEVQLAVQLGDRSGLGLDRDDRVDALDLLLDLVGEPATADRKSTRLNSSHANISYAVFCLKKKKKKKLTRT